MTPILACVNYRSHCVFREQHEYRRNRKTEPDPLRWRVTLSALGPLSGFQSGSLVSALFEAAPIPLIIFDSDQGLLSANEAFTALTGIERDDILGGLYPIFSIPPDGA